MTLGLVTPMWFAYVSYWASSIVIDDPYGHRRPGKMDEFADVDLVFDASERNVSLSPFASSNEDSTFVHDRYAELQFGPVAIPIHPRRWASVLIFIGTLMIIAGVVALFHFK